MEGKSMIVTITNQKGGIGKTTTVQNLGAGLVRKGNKVLLIDLDSQGNLSLAVNSRIDMPNSYDLMTKRAKAIECIQEIRENFDIIAGSPDLSMLNFNVGVDRLKGLLKGISSQYDYILIDTPPNLNSITLNSLTAADRVLIPCQADFFSLDAVRQLYGTIQSIRQEANENLKIDGILLTRYNGRSILTKEITEEFEKLAESLETKLYKAKIREAIAVKESQTMRSDIFAYSEKSNVAKDYAEFTDEFLEGMM